MPAQTIKKRSRYFMAVEGESEQSFIAWLQMLSQTELHIHLESVVLGGGGFKSMLEKAVQEHKRRCKKSGAYKNSFLIVDSDRAGQGDWSVEKLKHEAAVHKIVVCVQNPNHEGLLLRMMPDMEHEVPKAALSETKLKTQWPTYKKPVNKQALARHFSLDDLLRMAHADPDLKILLENIGLMGGQ